MIIAILILIIILLIAERRTTGFDIYQDNDEELPLSKKDHYKRNK